MKLKTRLIIGFITVMILPLILSLMVIIIFGQLQIRSIEKNYGITDADYTIITNPISALYEVTEPTFQQITITANRDVKQLEDLNYLEDINRELSFINSYLLVRQDQDLVYQGKEITQDIKEILPEYEKFMS